MNILAHQNFPKCVKMVLFAKLILVVWPDLTKTAGTHSLTLLLFQINAQKLFSRGKAKRIFFSLIFCWLNHCYGFISNTFKLPEAEV